VDITNNEQTRQFEAPVEGGVGFLRYRIDNGSILLLYVEVPPESQGRGVAAELSRTALEFAKERGLKVVPVCSYVAAYVRRHPEYLVR
jgi:predicted GNAT family acetyltransferase